MSINYKKINSFVFSCTWCDQHRRTTDSPVSVYEVRMAEGGWLGRSGSLEEIDSTANTHRSSQSCHKPAEQINTFASYIAFFLFDQFYLKYEQLC